MKSYQCIAIVGAMIALSEQSSALFYYPPKEPVPIVSLLEKTQARIKAAPEDSKAHYTLGRIHYLAFVSKGQNIEIPKGALKNDLPDVSDVRIRSISEPIVPFEEAKRRALAELGRDSEVGVKRDVFVRRRMEIFNELTESGWAPTPTSATDAELAKHLTSAVASFEKAMELAPSSSLYQLGYASLLEEANLWCKRHPKVATPTVFGTITKQGIRSEYLKAWRLSQSAPSPESELNHIGGDEAANAFMRLAAEPMSESSDEELRAVAEIKEKFRKRAAAAAEQSPDNGTRIVTPIIFPLRKVAGIDALLAPEKRVSFPLRGWGPNCSWSWVKPETGILVWNPTADGQIRSGAQLFGSYTWGIFWDNGYQPLAVLDLDGDTILRGAELSGIRVWFDRNGNGVSDGGEVLSLTDVGITWISASQNGSEGIHPMNSIGVGLGNGRTFPTWDWMTTPIKPPKE